MHPLLLDYQIKMVFRKRRHAPKSIKLLQPISDQTYQMQHNHLWIFSLFDSQSFIESLVYLTNLYATQLRKKFHLVAKEQIRKFLGMNIMMGMKKLPSYRDYWSKNSQLNDPYISSLISVNSFGFVRSNLHMNNNYV